MNTRLRALRLAFLAAALSAPCVQAEPAAPGLGFDEALALAQQRAPALAAREASLAAARALEPAADELPDPNLMVGIDNLPVEGAERWSLRRDFMTMRRIGWSQDVPNRAKRGARAEGAAARSARERALLLAQSQAVKRAAAQAWIGRWYAERRLALFAELEGENRLLQDTVHGRIAGGQAPPAEAAMARQAGLALADRRDALQAEAEQARASLKRWIGEAAVRPLAGEPPAFAQAGRHALEHLDRHVELLPYEPLRREAEAELREAQAATRGDWGWEVAYGKRGPDFSDMVSLQLRFELPLRQGERQQPRIAARARELGRIDAEREDLARAHVEEIERARAEITASERQLARLRELALPLAAERVALSLASYRAGRSELGAVLAARGEAAETRLRELALEAEARLGRAALAYLIVEETP